MQSFRGKAERCKAIVVAGNAFSCLLKNKQSKILPRSVPKRYLHATKIKSSFLYFFVDEIEFASNRECFLWIIEILLIRPIMQLSFYAEHIRMKKLKLESNGNLYCNPSDTNLSNEVARTDLGWREKGSCTFETFSFRTLRASRCLRHFSRLLNFHWW